jgi:hypothetical protein
MVTTSVTYDSPVAEWITPAQYQSYGNSIQVDAVTLQNSPFAYSALPNQAVRLRTWYLSKAVEEPKAPAKRESFAARLQRKYGEDA